MKETHKLSLKSKYNKNNYKPLNIKYSIAFLICSTLFKLSILKLLKWTPFIVNWKMTRLIILIKPLRLLLIR